MLRNEIDLESARITLNRKWAKGNADLIARNIAELVSDLVSEDENGSQRKGVAYGAAYGAALALITLTLETAMNAAELAVDNL